MMGKLAVEDCMCPICMSILIEPVTMPCSHTLCMPCFKQNVEEASLSCPLCRTRISVWARRATKNGNLVNEKLWNTIKTSYKDKVDKRLAGDDDDDNAVYLPIIQLSDPGEIRKEYEAEMERLSKQRELERQKEIEASEALIKKLQEEEMGLLEKRKKTEKEDEKLAKELTDVMDEAGTDAPINFLLAESQSRLTRSTSAITCSSGTSGRSSSLRPASTIESFISKMREAEKLKEADRISSTSSMPFLNSTPDRNFSEQSGKFLKVEKVKDIDSKSSGCSLPYMCNNREKSDCSSSISVKSKSRASSWNYGMVINTENEGLFSDELSQDLSKRSSSCASDGLICMGAESSGGTSRSVILSPDIEVISDKPENSSPSIFKNERAPSKASRASSVQSLDSITQELNHFKPINVCPVTPPRKLASGKVVEPPLIRTTPRNLNKTSFSSPTNNELSLSDLDACSPIMQRRLSELEEERKINVRRLSKSTITVKRNDEDERNENQSSMDMNNSSKGEQTYKGSKRKDMDIGDIKMSSNEACVAKKLMIPLESNIDDSMDFDIPPPLCENNNIINVDSDSRSSSGSALLRKKRACALKQEDLQSQNLYKKEISEEKHRLETFSPQRSITDWIVKGGKSCRESGQSPGFFTLQETCRDEVDGDLGRRMASKKSNFRTIDHFMTKVEKDCKKSKTVHSKRKRKTTQNKDYIWPDYSPKKREKVSTNMATSYDCNLVESEDEGNREAPIVGGKKRCFSDAESEKTNFKRRKIVEVSKGNTTKRLKNLKKTRSTVKSSKSKSRNVQNSDLATSDICNMSDLTETSISEPVDANLNAICSNSSSSVFDEVEWRKKQEQIDELYAIKLAKEFEMEARLRLNSCRFKGSDNEYKLRRHPRRNTCSDM